MLGQQIINGLALGGVYALITIGYSMVFSILKFMNFAHGDVYTLGSMLTGVLLVEKGVSPVIAIPAGILLGSVAAIGVERVAYRPLRDEDRSVSMIAAFASALIIRNISEYFWESRTRPFPSLLGSKTMEIFGLRITSGHLGVLFASAIVIIGFNIYLRYTKSGKAILFVSQDMTTSSLMGIPVNKTVTAVYAIGGMLGVIGGIMFCSIYNSVYPWMGHMGTMKAFTAAIIGGIGNLTGATCGAFILAMTEVLASSYISSAFRDAISFGLLIVMLLVKPSGLFGDKAAEQERV